MTISLLHIVVPTILILVVLILYINVSKKHLMNEIRELKTQLDKLDNVPGDAAKAEALKIEESEAVPAVQITVKEDEEKEKQDEPENTLNEAGASEYNTGKSGKTYTKEELELLIKE